ncbi:phospholipid transport system substrate-binding protein [Rhodobacter aestuarii]|uniref:Phospholipid transport system substrate-binding protein n=2 Tax=Rhodobacter aestuarii TaxID=453582 RepID=A0A1N7LSB8_9RHOB|nr:phospholipid transport system substrate-binding protein [Rhodobacter aestuarii]SIS76591.1 phospholipid transport system substrate-binding protein [Rhodobacter aestuarii]
MKKPGIPMKTPMRNDRRQLILGAGATVLAAGLLRPGAAFALTDAEARELVSRAVNDVNAAIASGKTGPGLYAQFEAIFTKYADVATIGRSALGVAARQASASQMSAFTKAFRGYISRKYGQRFREFIGARFEVEGARKVKTFYEVKTVAHLRGQAPFEVLWHVSDRSGKRLFFNVIIEGVNMLAAERTEIGAMLDARRGNIDALIADLKNAS